MAGSYEHFSMLFPFFNKGNKLLNETKSFPKNIEIYIYLRFIVNMNK